jgi:hypothetical protein
MRSSILLSIFALSCASFASERAATGSELVLADGFECPAPVFDMLPVPQGVTNPTPLVGTITTWDAFFGRAFPGLQGDQGVANLQAGQYLAVEFRMPFGGFSPDRVMQGVINGGGGQTKATIAISPCPGVLRQALRCTSWEGDPSLGFTMPGAPFPLSGTRCPIESGQVYYLNIANRICEFGTTCSTIISLQTTFN